MKKDGTLYLAEEVVSAARYNVSSVVFTDDCVTSRTQDEEV
jgi:hypothetical protein